MAFPIPDFEELRQRYLQEVLNQAPEAATGDDSDHFVRASGIAAAVESLHQHVSWLSRQVFASTADVEYLEQLAGERGLPRKPAALATGSITISGTATTPVSAGMQWQAPNGALYQLTANATIGGGGTVVVAAQALVAGVGGNLAAATVLTQAAPIAGVTGAVIVSMADGEAAETDDSLRERLLERMRNAPAGGNAADYKRWALEVAGVDRAYVFGARRGLGTVDVAIMAPTGLPGAGLIATASDYIQARRPVATDVLVLQPDLVNVTVLATVTLSGVTLAVAQAQAAASVASYLAGLVPGQTVFRSSLIAAIQNVTGVQSVVLTTPTVDVTTTVSSLLLQLANLTTVTLTV